MNNPFLELTQNASLLLAMVFIFGMNIPAHLENKRVIRSWRNWARQVLCGLLAGAIGIALMLTPWEFSPGIIFDTRSILLGVSGLFFGLVPTLIAMLMTAAFRLYTGGAAAWTGSSVILATGAAGIAWRHLRRRPLADISRYELYLFGLAIHLIMLALMFSLPWTIALKVLANISLPVIAIYPLGTMLLGMLLANRLQREQDMARLRESEANLRETQEIARMGRWELDLGSNHITLSNGAYALFDIDQASFSGTYEAFLEFIHPEDRASVDQSYRKSVANKTPFEVECRLPMAQGQAKWVNAIGRTEYDGAGHPVFSIGTVQDITARKRVEAALRESEQSYRNQFANNSAAMLLIDPTDGALLDVNAAALCFYGYPRERLLSMRISDINTLPVSEVRQAMGSIQPGQGKQFEFRHRLADGSVRDVEVSSSRIQFCGRSVLHSIIYDITERKRAEAALLQANGTLELAATRAHDLAMRAEAANVAKSQFLANMSHEIRTPMNGIIVPAEIMLLHHAPNDQQRELLEMISASGQHLVAVINDILDFSKMEAHKVKLDSEDFSIREFVESHATSLVVQAAEKGLWFTFEVSPTLPAVLRGDPRRLAQVLTNLGSNALKFTEQGGVSLRVELAGENGGKTVIRFSVTDTGVGVPAAYIDKLFQPFVQVDGAYTRKYGGTGIGLAICRQLTTLLGGEIGVDSVEGQGSTFWFTAVFEKCDNPAPPVKATARGANTPSFDHWSGARALVVEDDLTNRKLAHTVLTEFGLEVETARNGREAMEKLRRADYDIVFMDCQMPEMDGYQATREIRGLESGVINSQITIVAMTAHALEGDREKCLAAGMDDYIAKPAYPHDVAKALDKWLPRNGATAKPPSHGEHESVAPATAGPELTVFDQKAMVARVMGNEEAAKHVVKVFIEDIPGQLGTLEGYLAAGDLPNATRQAHKIKGVAANVGAEAMRNVAFEMEKAGGSGALELSRELMPRLKLELARLNVEMMAFITPERHEQKEPS